MNVSRVHSVTEREMETAENVDSGQCRGKGKKRMKNFLEKMERFLCTVWHTTCQVGKQDPRKVIHAFKFGISLSVVSLVYLSDPSYEGMGENAIWAVMTVVVVLEFTAGATLCKGLNRGTGTLLAGSLAFFIEYIANESGQIFRAIFIGTSVFVVGAMCTYLRFFPYIKRNYDYGVLIFLLTFNLISVSSYRVESVLKVAHERLYTIIVGCVICLLMSLLIFPNWSGEDLHNATVSKLEGLAKSMEACVNEYFNDADEIEETHDTSEEDPIYEGFKAVLDSKSNDESMALHASWEPRTRHGYRYPWQQYVELGGVIRQFGYTVAALHGCLRTEIQTPRPVRALLKDPCVRLAGEVSNVLKELANSIRIRRHCSPEILSDHLHKALQDLNTAITSQPRLGSNTSEANVESPSHLEQQQQQQQQTRQNFCSGILSFPRSEDFHSSRDQLAAADDDERIMLRKQVSKMAITSLEFSEALPLAAFASLLVETAAKLDIVIAEVEKLGRMARFVEFKNNDGDDHGTVTVTSETPRINVTQNHLPSRGYE